MDKDPFEEYLKESEPDKASKGYAWSTAIGLQAVDGLKPSKYLIDIAIRNIEGKITIKEVQNLIRQISRSLFTANSFGVFMLQRILFDAIICRIRKIKTSHF